MDEKEKQIQEALGTAMFCSNCGKMLTETDDFIDSKDRRIRQICVKCLFKELISGASIQMKSRSSDNS